MGLFDQAIATCKQYLQPVKRVTRKVIQLENQAKYTKEQDDINEETKFEEIFEDQKISKKEEALIDHRKSLKRAMLNNSRTTNGQLSPISESGQKVKEAPMHPYKSPDLSSKKKKRNHRSQPRSFQVKFNQMAPAMADKEADGDNSVTFREGSSVSIE